jgi:hypothetical protein
MEILVSRGHPYQNPLETTKPPQAVSFKKRDILVSECQKNPATNDYTGTRTPQQGILEKPQIQFRDIPGFN